MSGLARFQSRLRKTSHSVQTSAASALNHFERRRKANVVGVGFERQPQNRHMFALNDPESLVYFFKKTVDALLVDAFRGFQEIEIDPDGGREMNESLHIFGKAKAAKT